MFINHLETAMSFCPAGECSRCGMVFQLIPRKSLTDNERDTLPFGEQFEVPDHNDWSSREEKKCPGAGLITTRINTQ